MFVPQMKIFFNKSYSWVIILKNAKTPFLLVGWARDLVATRHGLEQLAPAAKTLALYSSVVGPELVLWIYLVWIVLLEVLGAPQEVDDPREMRVCAGIVRVGCNLNKIDDYIFILVAFLLRWYEWLGVKVLFPKVFAKYTFHSSSN